MERSEMQALKSFPGRVDASGSVALASLGGSGMRPHARTHYRAAKCYTWMVDVREVMTMAISDDSKRITVTLSKKLLAQIDDVCERTGMSRRAWIEYTLGMAMLAYGDLISGVTEGLSQGIPEPVEAEG